jgi:hypothetical protein
MTFRPGESGNPAGRPRGSRNKKTIALEALVDGESEAVMQKMITLAKMASTERQATCRVAVQRGSEPRL